MRWGIEVWDKFEDVSSYVNKGIEFCERYEEFWKKRCSIENSYAKNLRKLIETFEPKKKDLDYIAAPILSLSSQSTCTLPNQTQSNTINTTYLTCFIKMLSELRDSAGQHELIAENVHEKILTKINQTVRTLKEERRKCIEEKDKCFAEHQTYDENLEKCKLKYEKAYKEVEKAEDSLAKVENDDSASKNDIKKQKSVCDAKKRAYDTLEAEYAKQLCEANRVKNLYYYEQLPLVFDQLQALETKRVESFQCLVKECVKIEIEVLPRIHQCLKEIESAANAIKPEQDTEVCVSLFKTGYQIPADHVFVYLNSERQHFGKSDMIVANGSSMLNGSINSSNSNGSGSNGNGSSHYGVGSLSGHNSAVTLSNGNGCSSNNNKSRLNKYRTLNRIKGLFLATTNSGKNNENDLYDLPPQQLKNELIKKINSLQLELDKQHKEREGLNKLKDIYSKNQKFGDSQSADAALKTNEEKLSSLNSQLAKYQEILNQIELNSTLNNNNIVNQQHQNYSKAPSLTNGCGSGEYYTSSSSTSMSMTRETPATLNKSSSNHIYQSPSKLSVESVTLQTHGNQANQVVICSSLPNTPMSSSHNSNNYHQNGTVAYAVSPVSHFNQQKQQQQSTNNINANKQAPLVSTNNNESFEDDDDDNEEHNSNEEEDDDDIEEENGCYESPTAALRNKIENYQIHQKSQIKSKTPPTATADTDTLCNSVSANNININNSNTNGYFAIAAASINNNNNNNNNGSVSGNGSGSCNGSEQYDHVDHNVYDQANGVYVDEADEPIIGTALVMYSFAGTVQNAMSIEESESLNVLEKDSGDGWTLVKRLNGEKGYVPTDYIQIVYY